MSDYVLISGFSEKKKLAERQFVFNFVAILLEVMPRFGFKPRKEIKDLSLKRTKY